MAGRSIHVRLDAAAADALDTVAGGELTGSDAVRLALTEGAARRRRRGALTSEVRRLAKDPHYRAEVAETQQVMHSLRASQ